jgi:hypothetical protein
MALDALAYNLTKVMIIMGVQPLMAVISIAKAREKQPTSLPPKRFDTAKTRKRPLARSPGAPSSDRFFDSIDPNSTRPPSV